MATLTVLLTQPPYASQQASDGIEFALASTNYGHECNVVFSGKGILQLLANQQPVERKNQLKQARVLPFYDIEPVYVCQASLAALNLSVTDLGIDEDDITLLDAPALHQLLAHSEHTVTF